MVYYFDLKLVHAFIFIIPCMLITLFKLWTKIVAKSQAHETLSTLVHRDGVPPKMMIDGSKEQGLGRFRKNCQEADCHLVSTES